jgi:hypothetical protein
MNKKFIAGVLALTMVVGMSATAFAGDTVQKDYDDLAESAIVSGNAAVEKPTIKITVPTNVDFIINPYMVEFNAANLEKDAEWSVDPEAIKKIADKVSGNQIIGKDLKIINDSDVGVAVSIDKYKVHGGDWLAEGKADLPGVSENSAQSVAGFPVTVKNSKLANNKNATKSIQLNMVLDNGTKKVTIKGVQDQKYNKSTKKVDTVDGSKKLRAIIIPKDGEGKLSFVGSVNPEPKKFYTYKDGNKTKKASISDPWTGKENVSVSFKMTLTPTTYTK